MKQALLVIDAQKIYALEDSDYCVENVENVVANINELIRKFSEHGDLIVYIKHIHAADGSDAGRMFDFAGEDGGVEFVRGSVEAEFIDSLVVLPDAPMIEKRRYDAFIGTNLQDILEKYGIEKVVICGFMTNFCCASTARHAHDIDYYVDFVIDAMGTPGTSALPAKEISEATAATIEDGFGMLVNTEDI